MAGALPQTPGYFRQDERRAIALLLIPSGAAGADPLWEAFEARCLVPYEHLSLPDTRGLVRDGNRWSDGGSLTVETTAATCAVTGAGPGDLGALLAGRQAYAKVAPGLWQSDLWREPRIEVEALSDGYLVRETDLES